MSWVHEVYQAFTGINAITGESVEGFDRTMAVMGALSGGIFSKFGKTLKGVDFLRDLSKSDNLIKDTDKVTDALDAARDYNKHGLDKDSIDGILKGAGDCLVYSLGVQPKSIFERILGVVESTAFAAKKRPCKEVIDDVVDSANKTVSPELLIPRSFNRGNRSFRLEQGTASTRWKHIYDRHVDRTRFLSKSKFDQSFSVSDIKEILSKTL